MGNSVRIITCDEGLEAQGRPNLTMAAHRVPSPPHPLLEGKGGWAPGWWGTGVTPYLCSG